MDETLSDGESEVSRLLQLVRSGDEEAGGRLMAIVYQELRGMAANVMHPGRPGHTLQPTALVHEAWMKLASNFDGIEGRRHFFALASIAMRSVMADHARAANRLKRGGGANRITLMDVDDGRGHEVDLFAFHDCLQRLAELNPRHARIVELRALGSLTIDETAAELGVSPRTVSLDWRLARAWLWRELFGD